MSTHERKLYLWSHFIGSLNCVKGFIKHTFLAATWAKWFTRSLVRRVHHRLEIDAICHSIFSNTSSRRFGLRECLRSLCTFHQNNNSTKTDSHKLNHNEMKTLKKEPSRNLSTDSTENLKTTGNSRPEHCNIRKPRTLLHLGFPWYNLLLPEERCHPSWGPR